jgi:hypothetical protein
VLRFRLDLANPVEQNHRNSRLFQGFCPPQAEVSGKDSLKLRCENGRLFLGEPLDDSLAFRLFIIIEVRDFSPIRVLGGFRDRFIFDLVPADMN